MFEIEDFRHLDQGISLSFISPRHFGAISHKKNHFAWSSLQLRLIGLQVVFTPTLSREFRASVQ
jgi:hypothetical protein